MKVRQIMPIQDAWQCDGPRPNWVMNCTERKEEDGEAVVVVRRRTGKQLVREGEWLVRDLDGDPLWFTNNVFWEQYEMVL
jgi:hypothetical protein